MVGKSGSGRTPGFKHSDETKRKIARTLRGTPLKEERKNNIARAKVMYDLDEKCVRRYEDLKANYPEQEDFFEDHQDELLFAMRDIRTEKELTDIRKYVESAALRQEEPYQSDRSSSFRVVEDVMIELIDRKREALAAVQ